MNLKWKIPENTVLSALAFFLLSKLCCQYMNCKKPGASDPNCDYHKHRNTILVSLFSRDIDVYFGERSLVHCVPL